MKKQVVLTILLVLAVIAGGILIAHGLYSGVSEHKDNATTSTERNAPADQKSDIQTTVNESTDTDTSGRQTLRILIPNVFAITLKNSSSLKTALSSMPLSWLSSSSTRPSFILPRSTPLLIN